MAKRKLESVTPESVDDLTDEQVEELQQEMRSDEPVTEEAAEQAAAPEASEQEQKPEDDKSAEQTEEKAAEQAAKPESEEDQPEKAETVDFKRYDYERNRRRDAEKKAEADRTEWARRFDELLKTQTAKPEPAQTEQQEDLPPDAIEDPVAAVAWVAEQMKLLKQEKAKAAEEQTAATQQEKEWADFAEYMDNEYAREIEADPSVKQAFEYAEASYAGEMKALGATRQQIEQGIYEYRRDFAARWANGPRNNNVSLGQFIQDIASTRGWSPKPAEEENRDEQVQQKQVQDNAEAARKARTLSNGGGSPGVSDALTPEQLLEMSEEEFDAIVKKHGSMSGALTAQ